MNVGGDECSFSVPAVIGAGTMGRGIAGLLAGKGMPVQIYDPATRAIEEAHTYLRHTVGDESMERIAFHQSLSEAIVGSDLIFEAAPEELELKTRLFEEITRFADARCVVATNTSTMDVEEIGCRAEGPERLLGCHWFNPAEIVPGVEVVPGSKTSQAVVSRLVAFLRALGKQPVVVKNSPGFVGNRIQEAMMAEAIRCLDEGLASAEEIDRVVKTTFGFRLAVCGPFEILDQVGLEVERNALAYLNSHIEGGRYGIPPLLDDMIEAGDSGMRAGRGIYSYERGSDELLRKRQELFRAVLDAAVDVNGRQGI